MFTARIFLNNIISSVSKWLDREITDSLPHSLMGRLAISTISPLFVDRFWRSLRFCYLKFNKEALSDGCRVKTQGIGEGFWILSDFRERSFYGPCGPSFIQNLSLFPLRRTIFYFLILLRIQSIEISDKVDYTTLRDVFFTFISML